MFCKYEGLRRVCMFNLRPVSLHVTRLLMTTTKRNTNISVLKPRSIAHLLYGLVKETLRRRSTVDVINTAYVNHQYLYTGCSYQIIQKPWLLLVLCQYKYYRFDIQMIAVSICLLHVYVYTQHWFKRMCFIQLRVAVLQLH